MRNRSTIALLVLAMVFTWVGTAVAAEPAVAHQPTAVPNPLPQGTAPQGYWDKATLRGATYIVEGWAFDWETYASSNFIDVYDYGPQGTEFHRFRSDLIRPDVNAHFGITGDHGFQVPVQLHGAGLHTVCVYAVDMDFTNNTHIGCRQVRLPANPDLMVADGPVDLLGNIDVLAYPVLGRLDVAGWMFDKRMPLSGGVATVIAYADNGRQFGVMTDGGRRRPDIAAAFPGAGDRHGFDTTLAPDFAAGLTVCASFYPDGRPELRNILGCREIRINPVIGFVDSASLDLASRTMTVTGWAIDRDHLDQPLPVTMVVVQGDAVPGSATAVADQPRPDVGRVIGLGDNHGFTITQTMFNDVQPGAYRVCVVAWGYSRMVDWEPCLPVAVQ